MESDCKKKGVMEAVESSAEESVGTFLESAVTDISPRLRLLRLLCVAGTATALGSLGMLAAQSTPSKSGQGKAILLFMGHDRCLHLHHWILCLACVAAVVCITLLTQGHATTAVVILVGLLLGAASSDFAFEDLSLLRYCTACLQRPPKDIWKPCLNACHHI